MKNILKNFKENISIVAIILFYSQLLGYLYMVSQLEYFNINVSFYQFNLFNDFTTLFLCGLLIAIPIIISLIANIIIVTAIKNIKEKLINYKNLMCGLLLLIISIVPLLGLTFIIYNYFDINFSILFKMFCYSLVTEFIIILLYIIIIKPLLKSINIQNDTLDKMFMILIIVCVLIISIKTTTTFGQNIAKSKRNFMIINNEYVSLYNTYEYAIVSTFTIEDNIINIHNSEIKKIDLNNQAINYKTFKGVKTIRNSEK